MSREREGRERVLLQAHTLFLERGFAEVSMQQIADAVGMTKASLYYHFRNKEDLFAHVVKYETERMIQGIRSELDGVDSFEEQLMRLACFAFTVLRTDMGRLMSDCKRYLGNGRHWHDFDGDHLDPIGVLRPYFERAQATGELRPIDLDTAIIAFVSMIVGALKVGEEHPEVMRPGPQEAETLVDLFLRGALARSPALRP